MKFCKEDILTVNRCPGIYALHNIVNNKYYIGRAKILRSRLLAHRRHVLTENTKYPIYKAILKYGLDNFELLILEEYKADDPNIEQILDDAEKFYIKKFNSYGSTGYNQTYGGDAGITGYKFTDEQRKHSIEVAKTMAYDGRYTIYVYDITDKTIKTYLNFPDFNTATGLNITGGQIRNLLIKSKYIISRTLQELNIKIEKYNNIIKNNIQYEYGGGSKLLPDKDEFIKDCNSTMMIKEICEKYNISRPLYHRWKNKFGIK